MTKELASARTPAPPPESALAVSRDLGLAVVATLMVGYADFLTGIDLRVFPLYFVPVGIIAWRGHRSMSLALTVLAIAVWEMSNRLAGMHYPSAFVFYWNLGVQWLSLLSCALLLSRMRRLVDQERAASRVDSLTGLANSRAFLDLLSVETKRSRRYGHPVTLAYVDLDNFKQVNDSKGHQEGDAVLVRFAEVLRAGCRSTDCVARLGGDEFALLLPETNADAVKPLLERLQQRVREEMARGGWPVSASIGAVCFERAPDHGEQLLRRADALMYEVKAAGKNAIRIENVHAGEQLAV